MQIKAIVLFATTAAAGIAIEKRYPPDYCHRDNCFRNLLYDKYISSATGFCATWLRTTSTLTEYAIYSTSETTTSTPEVVTATVDETVTATVTTGTDTITTYVTAPDQRYRKRDATSDYPSWLSTSCNLARVTSACSCFIKENSVAPLTIYETSTITTATDVASFTETLPTTTETVTDTETATSEVAAATTTTISLKCGIKGCGRVIHVDDTDFFKTSRSACKSYCLGRSSCKSYSWTPPAIGPFGICAVSKKDADTFYNPASPALPVLCGSTKIYDRLC